MRLSPVALIAAVVLICPNVGNAAPQQSTPPPAAVAGEDRLIALLRERLELVRQSEQEVRKRHLAGAASGMEMTRAEIATLRAELDLAGTTVERVALHERIVERVRLLERAILKQFQAGVAQDVEVREARLATLDAEIALERERRRLPQAKLSAKRPT